MCAERLLFLKRMSSLNGKELIVHEFRYMGVMISKDGCEKPEVESRMMQEVELYWEYTSTVVCMMEHLSQLMYGCKTLDFLDLDR